MEHKKAVILLSGGLDSTTILAIAKSQNYEIHAISFNYGQRHNIEIEKAVAIAKEMGVASHKIADINLGLFGGSALTADIDVPKHDDVSEIGDKIPITYVPARNIIFLSFALGLAEVIGSHDIFIGVNALDYSGYPDCRAEFIASFEQTANLATADGVSGKKFKIHTPLIDLTKAQIIKLGMDLGVNYDMTISCYDPDDNGNICAKCDSCLLRQKGFDEYKASLIK